MVSLTLVQIIALLSTAQIVAAAPKAPLEVSDARAILNVLEKRQSSCADIFAVVCAQIGNTCRGCEAGYYCLPDNSCCEIGQTCAGFAPCVNAGFTAPSPTTACPTIAPLCTVINGNPGCSGSLTDWITISEALNNPGPTTAPTSSTESEDTSSTSSSTSTEEAPTYEPTTSSEEPTYAPPEPTDAPAPTGTYVPPPAYNTTTPPPPVATGDARKNYLDFSAVLGFGLFAVLLL